MVELLCDRIDELGRFIRDLSHEPPAMDTEKYNLLNKALAHLRLLDAIPSEDLLTNSSTSEGPGPTSLFDNTLNILGYHQERRNEMQTDQDIFDIASRDALDQAGIISMNDGSLVHGTDGSEIIHPSFNDLTSATINPSGNPFVNWGWSNEDLSLLHTASADFSDIQNQEPILNQRTKDTISPADAPEPPQQDNNSSDAHGTETLVNQLADRIGSLRIGPGGQVRYDGATSNFNLVDMGASDNLTVHRTARHDGPLYLQRLDMGKEVPPELEAHLSNLYFTWQDPAFHVVKRDMFEKARVVWREEQRDTPYFSETLQNAVCSLGAAFEARHFPTFTTYPKSLADFFADRAKILLELELDTPCIATVQALVVLSGHDIGCKRDSRGWLYSGKSCSSR